MDYCITGNGVQGVKGKRVKGGRVREAQGTPLEQFTILLLTIWLARPCACRNSYLMLYTSYVKKRRQVFKPCRRFSIFIYAGGTCGDNPDKVEPCPNRGSENSFIHQVAVFFAGCAQVLQPLGFGQGRHFGIHFFFNIAHHLHAIKFFLLFHD
jgi:hypothetical protein